jgi:hypothetical protein
MTHVGTFGIHGDQLGNLCAKAKSVPIPWCGIISWPNDGAGFAACKYLGWTGPLLVDVEVGTNL